MILGAPFRPGWGTTLGIQPHVVEAVLNHQSGSKRGVAGVYNYALYKNEVRAAMAMWSDHIRALVEGTSGRWCLSSALVHKVSRASAGRRRQVGESRAFRYACTPCRRFSSTTAQ
jgi:hypothetical protein